MQSGTAIDVPSEIHIAEKIAKRYSAGRLLIGLALFTSGAGCIVSPWSTRTPNPSHIFLLYIEGIGLALIAAAAGMLSASRIRIVAFIVGAWTLLLAVPGGAFLWPDLTAVHFIFELCALAAAIWMLFVLEHRPGVNAGRRFERARLIFGTAALACVLGRTLVSAELQSGFDMFYYNYDVTTLFNSLWAWNSPPSTIIGALAALGAAALLVRRTARYGAILLSLALVLYLPLLILYRFDDFCGAGQAVGELLLAWALDLGVAGGSLIVAAVYAKNQNNGRAQRRLAHRWQIQIGAGLGAVVLLLLLIGHGLVPLFFYETNLQGSAKLGPLADRIYAATYVPSHGNTVWRDELREGIASAGEAGRRCAAGDSRGCLNFAGFYRKIGWNWSRASRIEMKAANIEAREHQP